MPKIKKVKKLPLRVKEIKKEEESKLEEEVKESEVENEEFKETFTNFNPTTISSSIKPERTLEEISRKAPIKTIDSKEKEEETRLYDEKEKPLYGPSSPSDSSKERTYDSDSSSSMIREIKNDFIINRENNSQRQDFSKVLNKQGKEERKNFENIQKREYDLEKDKRRKYLM